MVKKEHHGYCTLVTHAEDIDKAVDKFRTLLLSLKEDKSDHGLFTDVQEVYMSSCVEVRSMPNEGFLSGYTCYRADEKVFSSISTAVRGAKDDECSVYDWRNDDDEEYAAPFVVFGQDNQL